MKILGRFDSFKLKRYTVILLQGNVTQFGGGRPESVIGSIIVPPITVLYINYRILQILDGY